MAWSRDRRWLTAARGEVGAVWLWDATSWAEPRTLPPIRHFHESGEVDYPLAEVVRLIPAGQSAALFYGCGAVALF